MIENKCWSFPPSHHGTSKGSSDLGDQFKDLPLNNLAREVIQNSLDARLDKEKPVEVQFRLFTIDKNDFPGVNSLFDYVLKLQQQLKKDSNTDPKDKAAVDNFLRTLTSNERMAVLRISDKNTTGLWGSSTLGDQNTPWFAFIKGAGKNQKSDTSGGSKGFGKEALFINSLLKTILVSTYAQNPKNGILEKASIGIAKMLSLTLEDGTDDPDYTQGIGFCVDDNDDARERNCPSNSLLNLDDSFMRHLEGFGTDIFIPAFAYDGKWDETMCMEAISSFLPAILDGDLVISFSQDGSIVTREINAYTVRNELLGNKKIAEETKALYNVLTSDQTKKIPFNKKPGFEMTLLLLQDNMRGLNKIFEYRYPTKMRIKAEEKDAGVSYTGVLLLTGDELCRRLRSVENAKHDKWQISTYKDTIYSRDEIAEAIRCVNSFLEEQCLLFGEGSGLDSEFLEVSGWNSDEEIYDMSLGENSEIGLPTAEIKFDMKSDSTKNPKRKPYKKKGNVIDDNGNAESDVMDEGKIGEGSEESSHPEGHNNSFEGEIHPGEKTENYDPTKPEQLVIGRRRIATANTRMPSISPRDGRFDLVFKTTKTGTDVNIEILKAGIDGDNEKVKIFEAYLDGEELKIERNKISLDRIEKNMTYRINLKLDVTQNYIWEVNIDAED